MSDVAAQAWPEPRAGSRLAGSRLAGSGLVAAASACALGAACAFAVAGLAWSRAPQAQTAVTADAAAPPPPLLWLAVLKPVRIFSFEAPQFRQQPLVYSARRLASGDAREDTLAVGAASGPAPMLRLALLRGPAPEPRSGLESGLAGLAARQELAATLGTRRGMLTTRFGRFETATLRIPGRAAPCDGFHLALASPALAIDGIACGTARADLACLIDRLDLASAGEDHALVDLFAAAELRRNPGCSGMRLGPDMVHAAWLDDKRATPPDKMRRPAGFQVANPRHELKSAAAR